MHDGVLESTEWALFTLLRRRRGGRALASVSGGICQKPSEEVLRPRQDDTLRLAGWGWGWGLPHECRHFSWKLPPEIQHSSRRDNSFPHFPPFSPSSQCTQFPHICSIFKTKPEGNSLCSSRYLSLLIYLITSPFISLDKQRGLPPAPSDWPAWVLSRREVLETESCTTPQNFSCFLWERESHCEEIRGTFSC